MGGQPQLVTRIGGAPSGSRAVGGVLVVGGQPQLVTRIGGAPSGSRAVGGGSGGGRSAPARHAHRVPPLGWRAVGFPVIGFSPGCTRIGGAPSGSRAVGGGSGGGRSAPAGHAHWWCSFRVAGGWWGFWWWEVSPSWSRASGASSRLAGGRVSGDRVQPQLVTRIGGAPSGRGRLVGVLVVGGQPQLVTRIGGAPSGSRAVGGGSGGGRSAPAGHAHRVPPLGWRAVGFPVIGFSPSWSRALVVLLSGGGRLVGVLVVRGQPQLVTRMVVLLPGRGRLVGVLVVGGQPQLVTRIGCLLSAGGRSDFR